MILLPVQPTYQVFNRSNSGALISEVKTSNEETLREAVNAAVKKVENDKQKQVFTLDEDF